MRVVLCFCFVLNSTKSRSLSCCFLLLPPPPFDNQNLLLEISASSLSLLFADPCVCSCFTLLDLDLLGFLLLPPPPVWLPRLSHRIYGVNVGMYIVAASYSHIYICIFYKYTNRIQARGGRERGKTKSVDLTHTNQRGETEYRLVTALASVVGSSC